MTSTRPRIGLFGNLGSGNLGNDGSVDVLVGYLRTRHPDAALRFMCMGPEVMQARYGAPAIWLQWYEAHGGGAAPRKLLGKLLDPLRTFAWVRKQDVVIVPGMGVLEATVPLRPWAFPYALFWLCVAGRLTGTQVALVGVGAERIGRPITRWLIGTAARLARYRSYRDEHSREAIGAMGVDVAGDEVYPDLVFGLPTPPPAPEVAGAVGVGVMAYHGDNDERDRSGQLHRTYVDTMHQFVRWLADSGRDVRLFTGDAEDEPVAREIQRGLDGITCEPAATMDELMRRMAVVQAVVATRYHNVICALKLAKPTVSVGYATKNDALMAAMGVGGFCQQARAVDLARLQAQFTELERRAPEVRRTLSERNRAAVRRLDEQFAALSTALLGGSAAAAAAVPEEVR